MKVEIIKKVENPLLQRTEISFKADHTGGPTPKRSEVREQLAKLLGISEELVVIEKLASTHGQQIARGIARAYKDVEQLKRLEPEYLLIRGMPKAEATKSEGKKEEEIKKGK